MFKKQLSRVILATLIAFVFLAISAAPFVSLRSVEAHGTRGADHTHLEGYGISAGCVDLGGNPFGYYQKYRVYPSAYSYADGKWHLESPYYWDNKGHYVGGPAKGWRYVCGF
jgi:hypothetical protein